MAYDQLPTSDKFERLEELYRTDVDWHKQTSKECTVEVPLKKLNRSIVVEGHASSKLNVRLFLYLWISERMAWNPSSVSLSVDHKAEDCLTAEDKKLHGYGFHHIDITETADAISKANRRSTGALPFTFTFHEKRPNIRHVSVCAVIEKSPEELASQLYVQTASLYIGQAMESSSRNIPVAQAVQKQVIQILSPFDLKDKLDLVTTENIFISCAETFLTAWNSKYRYKN